MVFAITVHEVAHGWVAKQLGDSTAWMLGRLTLNPLKHIDPVGTLLVPGLLLALGGIVFGWAKPVPVTYQNLRHPQRDMALVALAGPLSNLMMALIWAVLMKIGVLLVEALPLLALPLLYMGAAGITINIVLLVLNLLPIPPLDGGRVLAGLLPGPWAWRLNQLEPYGIFIVLGLMLTGLLGQLLLPATQAVQQTIYQLMGL
ncbi:MAG: peptidase M50 [Halothiobacillaceae bacterium]|nr:MAG: peptidase M50 [Halothiobacillaceae bacterium]